VLLTLTGLLALVTTLAVLVGVSPVATGRAAAATPRLTPDTTHRFAVRVLKSTWGYWAPQLDALGHPSWRFRYRLVDGSDTASSGCGVPVGDGDEDPDANAAFYCRLDNGVYLSTQWLYDHTSNNGRTPYGVAYAVAHEVGHAVQRELGIEPRGASVKTMELQADCFSAMWVRHQVALGNADAKDAADARGTAQALGDYEYESPGHHGTADERVWAWTLGYQRGLPYCLALNPPAG
jgi:predicted metalloprotease